MLTANSRKFVLGIRLSEEIIYARLPSDGGGSQGIIAGDHDRSNGSPPGPEVPFEEVRLVTGFLCFHFLEARFWIMTNSCYGANQALARGL